MMLQLNPTISVKTPKGDAEALIIIDYGVNVNSVWLCRMRGGEVLHFYSDDIRVYDNPMNGNGWDVGEEIKSAPKDEGFLKRVMAIEKRVAELHKELNEPDLPSGEDDIVLDFGKEQQPKTTIGAIDAKDLANFCAKKKMEADTNYILVKCDRCGCTPSLIYRTNNKTLCRNCYYIPEF